MKSRWIINLVLILAVGALALVAWYEPGIDKAPEAQAITSLDRARINRVRIERAGRDALILSRSDARGWRIEHQPPLPADTLRVDALARLATQEPVRSYLAAELELSRLALDPPQATVLLNDTRLDFGGTEPLEGLRYVRAGARVYLIPDAYQHLIEAGFTGFVRRRLLPEEATVTALSLPGLALTKSGPAWRVDPEQEVSADRLQQLIDNWRQAVALSVSSLEAGAQGEPVTLSLADLSREMRFLIGAREPELVLIRPDLGLEYHMGDAAGRLLKLPEPIKETPE
ncbi:MAG: DUF4340 domain-containing protein [Gammaproteobacteria bacterium]|jgi:hypothetical protein